MCACAPVLPWTRGPGPAQTTPMTYINRASRSHRQLSPVATAASDYQADRVSGRSGAHSGSVFGPLTLLCVSLAIPVSRFCPGGPECGASGPGQLGIVAGFVDEFVRGFAGRSGGPLHAPRGCPGDRCLDSRLLNDQLRLCLGSRPALNRAGIRAGAWGFVSRTSELSVSDVLKLDSLV